VVTIEKRILEFVNLCQASLDDIEGMGESPRLVSAEPLQGALTCCCEFEHAPDAPRNHQWCATRRARGTPAISTTARGVKRCDTQSSVTDVLFL
jgi:hypothetical protein